MGREVLNYIAGARVTKMTTGNLETLKKTEVKFITEVILEDPRWLCNAHTATAIHHSALTS